MIQEILDYLLIRSFLINSSEEEIIGVIETEENFAYILNSIYELMQEENFIFTSHFLCHKVQAFINKYRFDYIKNKEYCEKMNYIIDRFNEYNAMSDHRKKVIVNDWIEEEVKARELPRLYKNVYSLINLISSDMKYFQGMISVGEPFEIDNVIEYVSLINIMMNKFSNIFEEDKQFLEVTKLNLETFSKIPLGYHNLKMVKKALKRLKNNYTNAEDVKVEVNYSLKKTKK